MFRAEGKKNEAIFIFTDFLFAGRNIFDLLKPLKPSGLLCVPPV